MGSTLCQNTNLATTRYEHYYYIKWDSPKCFEAWPQLVEDARLIIEAADVDLTGNWNERKEPIPPIVNLGQICVNGIAENGHEPFVFGPNPTNPYNGERVDPHEFSDRESVKTNRKPYNLVVATFLLRAHYLLREECKFHSDGGWDDDEWVAARDLYQILWPGELVFCPWAEEVEGVQTAGYEDEVLNATPAVVETQESGEEKLRQLQLDTASLSRLSGPVKSTVDQVDYRHPRQWLDRCVADTIGHTECRESATQWNNLLGVTFRVIDVHRRCIVKHPQDCPFLILTYVWGGVDQPKLSKETIPLFSAEGGLTALWGKMPTTVRDAIEVCQALGERYLWVDALCIQQDSSRDMRVQILRMKRIYSSAKCTIVAASAATADVGLLGAPGDVDGAGSVAHCTSEDALDALLETTPWNSRAWCYQEKVLSHRALIFTSNGIYMQCQEGTYSAQTGERLTPRGAESKRQVQYNSIGGMLSVPPGQDLESYISAVEYYSARKLTWQADKLSAFHAIFERYRGSIDGTSSGFLYGMPVDGFDQLICWQSQLHNPNQRNRAFPSWSWLGWNDPVIFNRKLLAAGRTRQLLQPDSQHWMMISGEALRARKIRRRAECDKPLGFPSALGPYYHSPNLSFLASTLYLSIDCQPVKTQLTNGWYAVRPVYCSYINPVVIPFMPTFPQQPQYGEEFPKWDLSVHGDHPPECEAKSSVLGYVWLDRDWRERSQPADCVLKFIAMGGEKREIPEAEGQDKIRYPNMDGWSEEDRNRYIYVKSIQKPDTSKWNITVLMCVQAVDGHDDEDERVQVMDCFIPEEEWERLGGYTFIHRLR